MTFMVIFDSFAAVSQSKADCLGANKAPFSVSLNIQDSHSANFSKPVAELSEAQRTDLRRVGSKAIRDLLELLHKDDPNGVMRALLNDPKFVIDTGIRDLIRGAVEVVKAFIDDIRMINVEVKQIELRGCAASKPKYELPAGTKIEILKLMAVDFKPRNAKGHPRLAKSHLE